MQRVQGARSVQCNHRVVSESHRRRNVVRIPVPGGVIDDSDRSMAPLGDQLRRMPGILPEEKQPTLSGRRVPQGILPAPRAGGRDGLVGHAVTVAEHSYETRALLLTCGNLRGSVL